jgi:septum formation protein
MIGSSTPLLLASSSPRRRELRHTLGIPLVVRPTTVDEAVHEGEGPDRYVARVVEEKLRAALVDLAERREGDRFGAVLAADTIVVLDGEVLGKPASDRDAATMLRSLSGRSHVVSTRFAVAAADGGHARAQTVSTWVSFRQLSDRAVDDYVATGEGRDKAGAYAVQGIGAFAVSRIEGSYSNVVGLPQCEVVEALLAERLLASFPMASSSIARAPQS